MQQCCYCLGMTGATHGVCCHCMPWLCTDTADSHAGASITAVGRCQTFVALQQPLAQCSSDACRLVTLLLGVPHLSKSPQASNLRVCAGDACIVEGVDWLIDWWRFGWFTCLTCCLLTFGLDVTFTGVFLLCTASFQHTCFADKC